MARTGGILTFCMIGGAVLGFLLSLGAQAAPVLGIIALLLYLAAFVMWFIVMIALKVNLDQNNYHRTGGLVWSIIALTVIVIIVAIVAVIVAGTQLARTGAATDPATALRALGPWAVVIMLIVLALQVCFLMLGMRLNEYSQIGGGVWKGAGIVLIIAAALGLFNVAIYIIMLLTQAWGLAIVAAIIGFIGLILWLVVWIMIGIGFMSDANRMAAAGAR